MAAPIRCPECGASSTNGDPFAVIEFIRVADIHLVRVGEDALVSTEILEATVGPTPVGRPQLQCCSCDYQWVTSRKIDWIGDR